MQQHERGALAGLGHVQAQPAELDVAMADAGNGGKVGQPQGPKEGEKLRVVRTAFPGRESPKQRCSV